MRELVVDIFLAAGALLIGLVACIKAFVDAWRKWRDYFRLMRNRGKGLTREERRTVEFISQMAVKLSSAEKQPLNSKHLSDAREFYLKLADVFGHKPKDYDGVLSMARVRAEVLIAKGGK